jgi:hypothetical protein
VRNPRHGGRHHEPARAVKRENGGAEPARGGAGRASPGAFRSRHHRIGDGEVIEAGFVGPVVEVVIRQAIGGIGGARRLGVTVGSPKCSRICRITAGRSMTEMIFIVPPQGGTYHRMSCTIMSPLPRHPECAMAELATPAGILV